MPILTTEYLDNLIDLPINLPSTELEPGEWLIVSTVQIVEPEAFTLRLLQAHVLAFLDSQSGLDTQTTAPGPDGLCVFPSGQAELVTPGLGLAYVGLYRNFDPLKQPSFQAAQEAPLVIGTADSLPPAYALRPLDAATYSAEGPYSMVVVNNTLNRKLRLTLTGQVRVTLTT